MNHAFKDRIDWRKVQWEPIGEHGGKEAGFLTIDVKVRVWPDGSFELEVHERQLSGQSEDHSIEGAIAELDETLGALLVALRRWAKAGR